MTQKVFASKLNLFLNVVLLSVKLVAGTISGSIAILSDAFNSFTDIVTSIIVYMSVKIANKKPDREHPFGHKIAEPIAALIICVLIGVLGFEIIKSSINRMMFPEDISMSFVVILIMGFSIFVKLFMWLYLGKVAKNENSPSLRATSIDSRNDVLVSMLALFGFLMSYYTYFIIDAVFGIIIALFILKSGYELLKDNIGYLMGEAANDKFYSRVRHIAKSQKGVIGIHQLKVHYFGTAYHISLHVEVDGNLSTFETHKISNRIENKLMKIDDVDAVFIHIDPIDASKRKSK